MVTAWKASMAHFGSKEPLTVGVARGKDWYGQSAYDVQFGGDPSAFVSMEPPLPGAVQMRMVAL
jgi:hypothetical protein